MESARESATHRDNLHGAAPCKLRQDSESLRVQWAPRKTPKLLLLSSFVFLTWLCWHGVRPNASLAYVGPGAGFAFLGSFLSLMTGVLLGTFSLLTWPLRVAWRWLRRGRAFRHASVKKIIFLGLDGLDPQLTEQFMREGKLPNLAKLRLRRQLQAAADDVSLVIACGMVHICDGSQSGQTQHFRFPRPRPEVVSPTAFFRAGRACASRAEAWEAAHSAVPSELGVPPQEPAVLGDPRRERHPFHRAAHSHHLSARRSSMASCSRRCPLPT